MKQGKQRRVTMKDIAQKAGVSQQCVSQVINKSGAYAESNATRKKVLRIAQELNYRPNHSARTLKTGRAQCFGLISSAPLAHVEPSYFTRVLRGVEERLAELQSDYTPIAFTADLDETYRKSIELHQKGLVDALIIVTLDRDIPALKRKVLPKLEKEHIPFIIVHPTHQRLAYNNVGIDTLHAGYVAAEHLSNQGYKDIYCYRSAKHAIETVADELEKGVRRYFKEQGIRFTNKHIIKPSKKDAQDLLRFHAAEQLFALRKKLPQAVIFPSDLSAYGALKGLLDRDVSVPKTMAILGCDDINPCEYYQKSISSIYMPYFETGKASVDMLLDVCNGKAPQPIRIKPGLRLRKTT